jgi:plastocyanin
MVAELSSAPALLGIAGGTALIVMSFVFLAARPRVPMAVVGVAFVVAAALITASVWIGLTGTPSTPTFAAVGGPSAAPPGGPSPTVRPPSTSPASPTPSATGAACQPSGTTVQVVAKGIAFDQSCLAAPAGQAFTIEFDNEDADIPHNVDILAADPSQDPSAPSLFAGDLVTGVATQTYDVPALEVGTYFFRCDVHPTQMFGTFVVAAG